MQRQQQKFSRSPLTVLESTLLWWHSKESGESNSSTWVASASPLLGLTRHISWIHATTAMKQSQSYWTQYKVCWSNNSQTIHIAKGPTSSASLQTPLPWLSACCGSKYLVISPREAPVSAKLTESLEMLELQPKANANITLYKWKTEWKNQITSKIDNWTMDGKSIKVQLKYKPHFFDISSFLSRIFSNTEDMGFCTRGTGLNDTSLVSGPNIHQQQMSLTNNKLLILC